MTQTDDSLASVNEPRARVFNRKDIMTHDERMASRYPHQRSESRRLAYAYRVPARCLSAFAIAYQETNNTMKNLDTTSERSL